MALTTRTTQTPIEVVYGVDQPARVTQVGINVVYLVEQPARTTKVDAAVVYNVNQPARTTKVDLAVVAQLVKPGPKALIPVWPVIERWKWKTTVTKAKSGREQRMALRTEPFVSVEYEMAILDEGYRSIFFQNLYEYIGNADRVYFPLWPYHTPLTQDASSGATKIYFDPTLTDIRAGEHLAIFNADLSQYDTHLIDSVDADGCTLDADDATTFNISTSTHLVCPAPSMRIEDEAQIAMRRFTGMALLNMTADAARTIRRPNQSQTLDTYNGKPIFDFPYLVNDSVREQFKLNITKFDNELSNPSDIAGWLKPQVTSERSYLVTENNLDFWRQVAYELKGNAKSFYMPSGRADFEITSTPSLGSVYLETTDTFVFDLMQNVGNRHLKITTANEVIYRTVIETELQFGGSVRLKLSVAIGSGAGDNDIQKVELMPLSRMASDEMAIEHMPNYKKIVFTVATVEA